MEWHVNLTFTFIHFSNTTLCRRNLCILGDGQVRLVYGGMAVVIIGDSLS